MKTHDFLRAATLHGADAIGLAKDFRSLEVGKMADLQGLDRNPSQDIRNSNTTKYVLKNGRLYEGGEFERVVAANESDADAVVAAGSAGRGKTVGSTMRNESLRKRLAAEWSRRLKRGRRAAV